MGMPWWSWLTQQGTETSMLHVIGINILYGGQLFCYCWLHSPTALDASASKTALMPLVHGFTTDWSLVNQKCAGNLEASTFMGWLAGLASLVHGLKSAWSFTKASKLVGCKARLV